MSRFRTLPPPPPKKKNENDYLVNSNSVFGVVTEIDLVPAFATFLCSLLIRLEVGIVVGIAVNVIILLYTLARPRVRVEKRKVCEKMAPG